jgi:antitoxin CcdA
MVVCYNVCMKARTNVSIERALLDAARARGLSLSQILEEAVRERLAQEEAERWLRDNRERIAGYGEFIAEHGTFSDDIRDF